MAEDQVIVQCEWHPLADLDRPDIRARVREAAVVVAKPRGVDGCVVAYGRLPAARPLPDREPRWCGGWYAGDPAARPMLHAVNVVGIEWDADVDDPLAELRVLRAHLVELKGGSNLAWLDGCAAPRHEP